MNAEAAQEILMKHLKSSGNLRSTSSRIAVLNAVLQSQGHFDAESLYYRMISGGTKISKATVYNTLDLLQECGLVSKYRFTEHSSRYEKAFGRPHHHHLICTECGKVIDYRDFVQEELELVKKTEETLAKKYGFLIKDHNIEFLGLCEKCR